MDEKNKRKMILLIFVALLMMCSYVLGYLMHGETICPEMLNITIGGSG